MSEIPGAENAESFAEMFARSETASQRLAQGNKVTGKVIEIGSEDVFVDLGAKEDGIMDRKDLLNPAGELTVSVGDTVEAYVVGVSSQGVRLSRSMAGAGMAALEDARDAGIPVEGRVQGPCKGGYKISLLGFNAFCPGSQMDLPADGEDPTGLSYNFLVTKVEDRGRNIVVSRRAIRDREREESLDRLLQSIKLGDTVEGTVTRLTPYGAFVELAPAVEGMVHISELGWSRVSSPDEVVSAGDRIRAKVISLDASDRKRVRIGLSAKQAQGNPWDEAEGRWKVGDVVEGTVRRLAPFGAFVEIAPGVEGLVHLSEMSWGKRVSKAEEVVAPGDKVLVKIRELDIPARRISLSLREAGADPWSNLDFESGSVLKGTVESVTPHGFFIALAPAVTGLLPASVIKNSPSASTLSKLQKGDEIEVVVESIDPAARRISLSPRDEAYESRMAEKTWRENAPAKAPSGAMAEALQRAFQKRGENRK